MGRQICRTRIWKAGDIFILRGADVSLHSQVCAKGRINAYANAPDFIDTIPW